MSIAELIPIRLKRPAPVRRANPAVDAARIWEVARLAEKRDDNYCVPTSAGIEVRYNHKIKVIDGDQAAQLCALAARLGVDPCDWVLYIYAINE